MAARGGIAVDKLPPPESDGALSHRLTMDIQIPAVQRPPYYRRCPARWRSPGSPWRLPALQSLCCPCKYLHPRARSRLYRCPLGSRTVPVLVLPIAPLTVNWLAELLLNDSLVAKFRLAVIESAAAPASITIAVPAAKVFVDALSVSVPGPPMVTARGHRRCTRAGELQAVDGRKAAQDRGEVGRCRRISSKDHVRDAARRNGGDGGAGRRWSRSWT